MKSHRTPETDCVVRLQNARVSLAVNLLGGAITDFHLLENKINPLSFKFSPEQMPENNRAGAPYQGHFICLGRWGEPSAGEIKAGMPNHGQFANIQWQLEEKADNNSLFMTAAAPLEGLQLSRSLQLDAESAVFAVEEQVTNTNPLGRVYNMVQHPTLSCPFLDGATQVDCNASWGFNQHFYQQAEKHALAWPMGYAEDGAVFKLGTPDRVYNSVFSFVVDKPSKLGWITAYSPTHQTLIGYVWNREEYPWIHLWQHWSEDVLLYRGLEFGTSGIHQPFKEILRTAPHVFDEPTFAYIDAGESAIRRYLCFLLKVDAGYAGVSNVEVSEGEIHIRGKEQGEYASLKASFKGSL